mgnify:CR=1 FL=1|tara:strand:- start:2216 stop:2476 length:261 start_codon:yes stop_codon:yes gene_type:complete
MFINEFDTTTQFEFECDLIINNKLEAEFDDGDVTVIVDLLKQHNITNFIITIGMNHKHQRIVTIQVDEQLSNDFNYDLTSLMLSSK